MNLKIIFIIIPVSIVIAIAIIQDIKNFFYELKRKEIAREKKLENLKSEMLEIELTADEMDKLIVLKALKKEKSTHKYLRSALKKELDSLV